MKRSIHQLKIVSIFLLLLFISCSNTENEKYSRQFDEALGEKNTETLTELVSNFEHGFLKNQYPNTNATKAYQQFLIDIKNKNINWQNHAQKSKNIFLSSDLRRAIYRVPDSVWLVKNPKEDRNEDSLAILDLGKPYLKIRYTSLNSQGDEVYTYARRYLKSESTINLDSIIKEEKRTLQFNTNGNYIKALSVIKNKNEFLKKLYDIKIRAGILPAKQIAHELITYKVDVNDPLHRKIIVLELVY